LLGEFFQCLKKQGYLIMSSDQLVKIEQCEIYTFPEIDFDLIYDRIAFD